jgi:hypothetical protein
MQDLSDALCAYYRASQLVKGCLLCMSRMRSKRFPAAKCSFAPAPAFHSRSTTRNRRPPDDDQRSKYEGSWCILNSANTAVNAVAFNALNFSVRALPKGGRSIRGQLGCAKTQFAPRC